MGFEWRKVFVPHEYAHQAPTFIQRTMGPTAGVYPLEQTVGGWLFQARVDRECCQGDDVSLVEPERTFECPKCALIYGADVLADDEECRCPACGADQQEEIHP